MPTGGTRPRGSTSWRPRARIAWRTSPRSRTATVSPKAFWAMSPHGRDGFTWDSMTSATRVKASVCRSSTGRRCRASRPSRIASPRRRSFTRPTSVVPKAHSRFAELPPDTRSTPTPVERSTAVHESATARSCCRGWAPPRSGRPGWCRRRPGGGRAAAAPRPRLRRGRRAGCPPGGRRTRPSAGRRGSGPGPRRRPTGAGARRPRCWRSRRRAATTRSTWLSMGERMQGDRRRDAGPAQGLDVLDAGVARGRRPRPGPARGRRRRSPGSPW